MALYAVEGDVGAGKTFCLVHCILPDYIRGTRRPIYTNLPIDGDEFEWYLCWLTPNHALRDQYRERITLAQPGQVEAFQEFYVRRWWIDERLAGQVIPRDDWPKDVSSIPPGWRLCESDLPWPADEAEEKALLVSDPAFEVFLDRRSAGMHDRVAEFWYFSKPNSVIVMDETADLWNALDRKSKGTFPT